MAEQSNPNVALHSGREVSLARARMVWALRPLGLLVLVLWILHPSTADQPDHAHSALLGFLFGAIYGLVIYGPILTKYFFVTQHDERQQVNRVPEEYYWGQIDKVMFDNN